MSIVDDMNPTELQMSAALLMARAEKLPKGDPKKSRLLLAAQQLLDKSRIAERRYNSLTTPKV